VVVSDGDNLSAECYVHSQDENKTVLIFIISEGKNREIRRICEHFGWEVKRLKREKIGGLSIGTLKAGGIKSLSEKDIDKIFSQNNR
ncbi:MAG: pseudouridine synthase, partial [Clostridia bacterium]|nr:pseudouridine synthase [Clostridia bacterium]